MTFAGLLPHKLKVFRRGGRVDRFNQPSEHDWEEQPGEYACRATTGSGGERNTERSREVYVIRHTVFCELGVDVREDDRVKVYDGDRLILEDGDVLHVGRPYGMARAHHVELDVEVYRGPVGA